MPAITLARSPVHNSPVHNAEKYLSLSIIMGLLRLGDAIAVLVPGTLALWIAAPDRELWPLCASTIVLAAVLTMNILHFSGAYRAKSPPRFLSLVNAGIVSWAAALGAITLLVLVLQQNSPSIRAWLQDWAAGTAFVLVASRCALAALLQRWRRAGRFERAAVILGAGPLGRALLQKLAANTDREVRILGFYDDRLARLPKLCLGHPIRGTLDDLIRDVRAGNIDTVFVAIPLSARWRLTEIMNKLSLVPVDVQLCADTFGLQVGECDVSHVGGLTVLTVCRNPIEGWRSIAKLLEDKILAAVILALMAPLMAIVAALIKLDSRGPVFFRQKRHGWNNELIEVLKFRTLYHEASDPTAEKLCTDGDPRVTRVGSFLRRSMIDELPQFINVLHGDMSIVGPRPHALAAKAGGLLYREAVKYYDARHRMKPGITGWAQVNGWRGETRTVEEIHQRVLHDLYYIEHWSIWLDLKIIARTVLGAVASMLRKRPKKLKDHAVSVANIGRSRSAA